MSITFEELDRRATAMGEIVLRRRLEPSLLIDIYEVKLGDEFLMSSLFTASEIALARLGLGQVRVDAGSVDGSVDGSIDVLVGGLGLGYTACTVLEDGGVGTLYVVEALAEVVGWHEDHLLPLASELTNDVRCHLVHGDFFAIVAGNEGFAPGAPDLWHAILVDIDHTPRHHLHPSHAAFYELEGLQRVAARLRPGGVFALWSDDPPDADFVAVMELVFESCRAHVVTFPNPHTEGESACTVYVGGISDRPSSAA